MTRPLFLLAGCVALLCVSTTRPTLSAQPLHRYLYVAVPASETDAPDYDGLEILVFDIDKAHQLVRRIPLSPQRSPSVDRGRAADGRSREHVRGIAADVKAGRLYLSTIERVMAIDLHDDRMIWEHRYEGGCCDRLDVSPDGAMLFAPAFGSPRWYVIDARDGRLLTTVSVPGWPRQTIFSQDGGRAFLGAWESRMIAVVDTASRKIVREVGPFSSFVCPFTVNGRGSLVFATVDGLVGFEVGDLQTGLTLDRVVVEGADADALASYECPSHGIAMTPDEREIWLADGVEQRVIIFDATTYPPAERESIAVRAQPRWIAFGIDGRYAYPSSGDVIDTTTRKVVGHLDAGRGAPVRGEKLLEVDFSGETPIRAGRQTGVGGR